MPSRHRSRSRALQVLFQLDIRTQQVEESLASFYNSLSSEDSDDEQLPADPFMEQLVRGTIEKREDIDLRLARHSEHWRLERMSAVDRNILRLALYEMLELSTPPAVVIDEALQLAHRFSGDDSVPFINGVLDAAMRQLH